MRSKLTNEACMFCPECGSEVRESAKFCWSCGKSLADQDDSRTNGSVKQPLKVSPSKGGEVKSEEKAEQPYFTEREGWIFTAVMVAMLIAMTLWAFSAAK